MTVEGTARDPRNFAVVDYGRAILHNGDIPSDKRHVKLLPLAGFPLQLGCRRNEAIDAPGVMARRLESRIDPATASWLVNEYRVSHKNGRTVSRAQKHALVIRACKCGRKIAGRAHSGTPMIGLRMAWHPAE